MFEGGRARLGTGENGLSGSNRKNFLLFLLATKSGVAEAAPFCRAASLTTNTLRCRCGEQQVVFQALW